MREREDERMREGEGAQGRRLLLLISQLLNLPTSQPPNLPTSPLLNLSHPGKLNNMERKADTFCF